MMKNGIWTSSSKRFFRSTHAAGIDCSLKTMNIPMTSSIYIDSVNPTSVYPSNSIINVGNSNAAGNETFRGFLLPNYSVVPNGSFIQSAVLKITPTADLSSNARTMRAFRVRLTVGYAGAVGPSWNNRQQGGISSPWSTAGCGDSTLDYIGATELGNMSVPASPTLNTPLSMTLLATEIQSFYDGTYGNKTIVLFVDTQANDCISYASAYSTTEAYKPYITITYF
jgi:hypothetical protein